MELNKIYNEKAQILLPRMPSNFVDLTVTSPPYDKLRDYKGFKFPFKHIARHLYRVTKEGGVVVWVVADQTVNGSETGESFRQALFFMECGFRLHDTMIYEKDSISFPETTRYSQIFEFMFVFSKGKPKTINLIADRKNKWFNGIKHIKGHYRNVEGQTIRHNKQNLLQRIGIRYNIWRISCGHQKSTTDEIAFNHPAIFPEKLVADHIKSWTNEGDVVFDPMGGSGTTPKMAHLLNRSWIMGEISKEYCQDAQQRLDTHQKQRNLFF